MTESARLVEPVEPKAESPSPFLHCGEVGLPAGGGGGVATGPAPRIARRSVPNKNFIFPSSYLWLHSSPTSRPHPKNYGETGTILSVIIFLSAKKHEKHGGKAFQLVEETNTRNPPGKKHTQRGKRA